MNLVTKYFYFHAHEPLRPRGALKIVPTTTPHQCYLLCTLSMEAENNVKANSALLRAAVVVKW